MAEGMRSLGISDIKNDMGFPNSEFWDFRLTDLKALEDGGLGFRA